MKTKWLVIAVVLLALLIFTGRMPYAEASLSAVV